MITSKGGVVEALAQGLSNRLARANLPLEFLGSWEHCSSGRKSVLAHSLGLGMLSASVADITGVEQVLIDVRLKKDADGALVTWQPDLIGCGKVHPPIISPVIYVDFESPNSSDRRIWDKDIGGYRRWLAAEGEEAPYVIVVCLPVRPHGYWPLRYTHANGYNVMHGGQSSKLKQQGPLAFWTESWRDKRTPSDFSSVTILNIGNGKVEEINIFK